MAIGSTLSVGLIGLKAFIVQVQAFISPGLPYLQHHRIDRMHRCPKPASA